VLLRFFLGPGGESGLRLGGGGCGAVGFGLLSRLGASVGLSLEGALVIELFHAPQ
jgi:hypothetical protein